jgi:isopenicillin-N N-acyltransferase like protein
LKKIVKYLVITSIILLVVILLFLNAIYVRPPEIAKNFENNTERKELAENFYTYGNNWFRKSQSGLFELYVEGAAFERGVANGKLAKELIIKQEEHFIEQIKVIVPSLNYLKFLKYLVAWFNRNLDKHIKQEYLEEIYGVSLSASDEFDFVGPKYQRMLNYHAAHDIGHALQDRNFTVGCTSFAAWEDATDDSLLIIGRNFDFYAGDKFAEDKIVNFVNPTDGYKFMFITWGGFIGSVSGMNENGLTVTINASKSDYPTSSATPISLLAREILQYASNIDEAYQIAATRKTFVSESILVGSAQDKTAAIIEKSPTKLDIVLPHNNYLICANNYQSDAFAEDEMNVQNILESSSQYRYDRMNQLIHDHYPLNYQHAAKILRDRNGLDDKIIGNGNEKAINQLIAHHSVVFKPQLGLVWVSTSPYQLGAYICYDLKTIFSDSFLLANKEIMVDSLTIQKDDFLYSPDFDNYQQFRKLRLNISKSTKDITSNEITAFIQTNPNYYLTYQTIGDYFFDKNDFQNAKMYYELTLQKVIATKKEEDFIINRLNECEIKLKQ